MRFEIQFLSCEASARSAILAAMTRLQGLGLEPEQLGEIEIVLAEVANNIVEHAYSECQDGPISIRGRKSPGSIILEFADRGAPMPGLRIPDGKFADVSGPLDALPEGGFGWFLIRQIASEVSYHRRENENHLSLRIDLPAR